MQKLVLLLATCILASTAFAQSIFDFSNKKPSSTTMPPSANVKVNPVVSPADFKKNVDKLYTQQQNQNKQEVKQQLSPGSLPTSQPAIPPVSAPKQPVAPNANAPVTLPNTPVAAPSPDSYSSYGNQPATTTPAAPGTAPAQTGPQPYTGFGSGNTNTKPSSPTPPNSGKANGWNITY